MSFSLVQWMIEYIRLYSKLSVDFAVVVEKTFIHSRVTLSYKPINCTN